MIDLSSAEPTEPAKADNETGGAYPHDRYCACGFPITGRVGSCPMCRLEIPAR